MTKLVIESLYYCEMSNETQRRARAALRREAKECQNFDADDAAADALVEQVWNAIVGREPEREDR